MKEENVDQATVDLLEREYKRFMAMAILLPGQLGMSGLVDELWHAHVLFTMDYAKFCESIAGYFIHHVPSAQEEGNNTPDLFREYTIPMYEKYFSHPMPDVWFDHKGDCTQDTCGDACSNQCSGCRMTQDIPMQMLRQEFSCLEISQQRTLLTQL